MPDVGELKLAFDGTVRSTDKDGRMHISKTHISKATVNGYYGSEIPNAQALGLDPYKVYYLLRDPVELARAASTFARLPILSKHIPISADAHASEFVVGTIGSDVEFSDPYLDADVCIWENGAIAGIETKTVQQFSCAYRYTADMTPGVFHGQRYDGVMREIHGNHLALVETGRAGSDVLAADEAITMKMTKLGKALFVTLGGMSPKLAQDSALPALVATASGKTLNVGELSTKLIAMDSELDPKQMQASFDALIALDMSSIPSGPMGGGANDSEDDEEDEKKKVAKDKKMAKDAEEEKEKKDEDKKAFDEAITVIKRDLHEAASARHAVREFVGDVIAQDSITAEEIYTFALDSMEVEHKEVTGLPALKALFKVAQSSKSAAPIVVAMDSAGLEAQFPEASRFRHQ